MELTYCRNEGDRVRHLDGRFVAARLQQAMGEPVSGALTADQVRFLARQTYPERFPVIEAAGATGPDQGGAGEPTGTAGPRWLNATTPPHLIDFLPSRRADCDKLQRTENPLFMQAVAKGQYRAEDLSDRYLRGAYLPRHWLLLRQQVPELSAWHVRNDTLDEDDRPRCANLVAWRYFQVVAVGSSSDFFSPASTNEARQAIDAARARLAEATADYENLRAARQRQWKAQAEAAAAAEALTVPPRRTELERWLRGVTTTQAWSLLPGALCTGSATAFRCTQPSFCEPEQKALAKQEDATRRTAENRWALLADYRLLGQIVALRDKLAQCTLRAEASSAARSAITLAGARVRETVGSSSDGQWVDKLVLRFAGSSPVTALAKLLGKPKVETLESVGPGVIGQRTTTRTNANGVVLSISEEPVMGPTTYRIDRYTWSTRAYTVVALPETVEIELTARKP
jgi:hypothetical protein